MGGGAPHGGKFIQRLPERGVKGRRKMGLKAPGILTFMLSVVLTVVVLVITFFSADIPMIKGHEFWALLAAQLILVMGCVMRGL